MSKIILKDYHIQYLDPKSLTLHRTNRFQVSQIQIKMQGEGSSEISTGHVARGCRRSKQ